MNGLLIGLMAWAVMCLALLIIALGYIDELRAELALERALRASDPRNLENGTSR